MPRHWRLTGALLLTAFAADAAETRRPSPEPLLVRSARLPRFPGFSAEVEVDRGGRVRHGRVIVESGGRVHVEHLDRVTAAWCRAAVEEALNRRRPCRGGWDTREECRARQPKPRLTWTRVEGFRLLAEVQLDDAGAVHRIRLVRHCLLGRAVHAGQ